MANPWDIDRILASEVPPIPLRLEPESLPMPIPPVPLRSEVEQPTVPTERVTPPPPRGPIIPSEYTRPSRMSGANSQLRNKIMQLLKMRQERAQGLHDQANTLEAEKPGINLRPFAALIDNWYGGKLADTFPKQASPEERAAMIAKIRDMAMSQEEGITKGQIDLLQAQLKGEGTGLNLDELMVPGYGIAFTKQDAQALKKEVPDLQGGINSVGLLQKLILEPNFKKWDDDPATAWLQKRRFAAQHAASIKAAFRISVTGGGNISGPEQAMLEQIVSNPMKIFSLSTSNLVGLQEIERRFAERKELISELRLKHRFPSSKPKEAASAATKPAGEKITRDGFIVNKKTGERRAFPRSKYGEVPAGSDWSVE